MPEFVRHIFAVAIESSSNDFIEVIEEAANFTISEATHNNKIVHLTSPLTITVDTTAIGVSCRFINKSGGTITFVAGTATIEGGINDAKKLTADNSGADVYFDAAGAANLIGNLVL